MTEPELSEDRLSPEPGGYFRMRCSREWTDEEPDTLTISVCDDDFDGQPFIVFSGSSTWLSADLVESEVIPWLNFCVAEARSAAPSSGASSVSSVGAPLGPLGDPE